MTVPRIANIAWLLIAVGLLSFGGLAVLALLNRRHDIGEAVCGHCGYPVRGLPTFICPECGSDLRAVGIVMPRDGRRLGRFARALLWTGVWLALAAVGTKILIRIVLPVRASWWQDCTFSAPASGAYLSVTMRARGDELCWPWEGAVRPPVEHVSITMEAPAASVVSSMQVDLLNPGYRYKGRDGATVRESRGVTVQAIVQWMTEQGIDSSRAAVRAEAAQLLGVVQSAVSGNMGAVATPAFASQSATKGVVGRAPATDEFNIVNPGFWILVWVTGIWLCLRRRTPRAVPAGSVIRHG